MSSGKLWPFCLILNVLRRPYELFVITEFWEAFWERLKEGKSAVGTQLIGTLHMWLKFEMSILQTGFNYWYLEFFLWSALGDIPWNPTDDKST